MRTVNDLVANRREISRVPGAIRPPGCSSALNAPVFRETTGARGSEDGLSETLDDSGNLAEVFETAINFGKQGLHLVGDAMLLGKRRHREYQLAEVRARDSLPCRSALVQGGWHFITTFED